MFLIIFVSGKIAFAGLIYLFKLKAILFGAIIVFLRLWYSHRFFIINILK